MTSDATFRTLGSFLTLLSACVKMVEGLLLEKNSLPTDQKRKPVRAKPATITTTYVMSFPAWATGK